MKTKIVLLVSFIVSIMTTCSNIPDDWEEALLTITFEQKGTLPADIMARLKYQINIKDSHGLTNVTKTIDAVESIQEKLAIGDYTISVKAIDPYDNETYAEEITQKNIQAGRNYATITINFNAKRVAAPKADPERGNYTTAQTITLSCGTAGATIYYTLDGNDPSSSSNKYTAPILIDTQGLTIILKAIAVMAEWDDSPILTEFYTIEFGRVDTPVAYPPSGEAPYGTTITLNSNTDGATIYYTLDGSEPTTSSPKYPDVPIILNYSPGTIITLKAIAVKGNTEQSETFTAVYTIIPAGTVTMPAASPSAGGVTIGTKVSLSAIPQDAEIWYTTDGSTPVPNVSTKYTDTNKITINAAMTIRAIAVKSGMTNSDILTAAYTILAAATPVAYPPAGEASYGTAISLSTATDGATIYYTLNGTEPTTSSLKYPDVPIILNYTPGTIITLKAIAVKDNMEQSETFTVAYGITPAGTVTMPVASPPAGIVTIGTEVALSAIPQDAEIWYTTDGSTPIPNTVGIKYTSKIIINAATTIIAIAVKTGMSNSSILVAAYTTKIIETVYLSGGTFIMGQVGVETPEHEVTLSKDFYMGKYQVTQEQYFAVMKTNPSFFSSSPYGVEIQGKRPVEQVSWYDALVFCNRLSDAEELTPAYSINGSTDPDDWGPVPTSSNATWNAVSIVSGSTGYRLPTEAQWEYACRAGKANEYNNNEYYNPEWDGVTPNSAPGWYSGNSGSMTHQVGLKDANDWGLYDMHGNVWEWCWDRYGTYPSTAQTDPEGASGSYRVLRGGWWNLNAFYMRSAYRGNDVPDFRNGGTGLRVVRPRP